MAVFQYKAKKIDGTVITGTIEAVDRNSLIQQFRAEDFYVYQVVQKGSLRNDLWQTKIGLKHIAAFCNQMSAMLKAGIPAARALDICQESAADKKLKEGLRDVSERVQKGQSLSQAMLSMGYLFPHFLIFMIETGETSGNLDQIMEKMAVHYEQEVHLKGRVQIALIYPCILAVVAIMAVVFMLTLVLPKFMQMFSTMELPMVTRVLLGVSDFLITYWIYLILGLVILGLLLSWLLTKEAFLLVIHEWILLIPVAGGLIKTIYTSRFAWTFSLLYGSGVGVIKSLDISGKVLGNSYVSKQLQGASIRLREGEMLSEALKGTGIFLTLFISMVMIGEESGSLEQILADTGVFYEKEANTAITQLIALLEPLLILIMGGIIGVIVLAIMLPIFQTYGNMV